MRYFVILLVLIGVMGTAYAESRAMLTPFDIYLSSDDFTAQGPNHNILALDKGESASLTVHVKNNDDRPHQITLKDPRGPDLGLFETFRFEPEQITVIPHQTNSTQLYLSISKDTDTHSNFVTFLGQSSTFGIKGLGFFVVVDREIDDYVDKSLRRGLPDGAFPHLNTEISESEAEKLIGSGFGIPKYLPSGYEFQGMDGSEDHQRFVYSPTNIDTETTVFSQFWSDGGLLIIYNIDRPNVNNTKSLPIRIAQDEGQQIMINDMMGHATEKQTRVVAESDITYDVPAGLTFFDDAEKKSAHLSANMPLDELLKIASSIPIYDGPDFTFEKNTSQQQGQMDYPPPRSSDIPPLKQFISGIPFSEIKCKVNLQLTQRYDGTPACVKDGTVFELIKRGWTSDIIRLVQSRDVFLDPKDATSSYMEKITPTLEDFKNTLSEPYDIDTIFSKFGEPHDDIGSGIHIYVYELNDLTEIWVGYVDDIWYVKHVDVNGNVLEDLFVKNEN